MSGLSARGAALMRAWGRGPELVLIPRVAKVLGSARVSRVGDRVFAITDFLCVLSSVDDGEFGKDCFGARPKPTRETRVLPKIPRLDKAIGYNRSLITSH
jgi:hypothetical protein